jgi:hypothetical protein
MLRPLPLDLFATLLPPGAGLLAFFAGKNLHQLSSLLRRAVLGLALVLITFLVGAFLSRLADWSGPLLYPLGGETVVACTAALLLLGVVWSQPGRSTSSGFLLVVVCLAELILGLTAGGRMWWRWFDTQARKNAPDALGCMQQTTGFTCSPAATVMLLHQNNLSFTEGELAYLAGTSLLGTDLYSMAQAVTALCQERGWRGEVERATYDTWVERGEPFVAHTNLPGLGGHALFIRRLTPYLAEVIDPRFGQPQKLSRAEFLQLWEGRALRLRRLDR